MDRSNLSSVCIVKENVVVVADTDLVKVVIVESEQLSMVRLFQFSLSTF
jgi:hypothetical protein